MIRSKYKIKIKGLENYRVTEEGELWKLETVDKKGAVWKASRIKKDEARDAYRIGPKYFTSKAIKDSLKKDEERLVIYNPETFLK
jgi:hypothetical protein